MTESRSFVTRDGADLMLDGERFHFSGTNIYWLALVALDGRPLGHADRPWNPREFVIDQVLDGAVATGARVVRSHTLGISLGTEGSLEPELGVFDEAAFRSADYAVAGAGRRGLRLMIPLTDQWRYSIGGISTRTGWRGFPNEPDPKAYAVDNSRQRTSETHFYDDAQLVVDHKRYIATILNHVNPHTGLAWKDDPTILAWETGNEISTAYPSWTADIARYIKHDLGAQQLIADGTASNRWDVHFSAVDCDDVDIVGVHFYPINVEWGVRNARIARAAGKAFVVGEFDWTDRVATRDLLAAAERERMTGTLSWSVHPRDEQGDPIPHDDGFALHIPGTDENMIGVLADLTAHAHRMAAMR